MKNLQFSRQRVLASILVIISLLVVGYKVVVPRTIQAPDFPNPASVETFEDCESAGFPILDSDPEQCQTPDGRTFTRVTTDESPTPITISGTYTCLPKKNTGGPVTLECALGLLTDKSYYGLDMSGIKSENYPFIQDGTSITIEGFLVPIELVSADRWQTYDIVGVISVERIIK